jgi:hypothetical protein
MRDAFSNHLQNRQRSLKCRVATTRHDGEVARLRSNLPARDGASTQVIVWRIPSLPHGGGPKVDDHRARAQSFEEAACAENDVPTTSVVVRLMQITPSPISRQFR